MPTSSAPAAQTAATGPEVHATPRALPEIWVWLEEVKAPRVEGEEPHDMITALTVLAQASRLYGYDRWITTSPGQGHSATLATPANAKPEKFVEPVTAVNVLSSLRVYFRDLISRGWDETEPVWFGKHVETAVPELSFEWAIHPNLVAMQLPDFIVKHFAKVGRKEQHLLSLTKEFDHVFVAATPFEEGYRQALEATALAMTAAGVSKKTIANVMSTALDALANNLPDSADDGAAPASEAPSA